MCIKVLLAINTRRHVDGTDISDKKNEILKQEDTLKCQGIVTSAKCGCEEVMIRPNDG